MSEDSIRQLDSADIDDGGKQGACAQRHHSRPPPAPSQSKLSAASFVLVTPHLLVLDQLHHVAILICVTCSQLQPPPPWVDWHSSRSWAVHPSPSPSLPLGISRNQSPLLQTSQKVDDACAPGFSHPPPPLSSPHHNMSPVALSESHPEQRACPAV